MVESELYFCCRSGGEEELGQIFRLALPSGGKARLQLIFESSDPNQFHYGDNLTVASNSQMIVCKHQSDDVSTNQLGITLASDVDPLAWLKTKPSWLGLLVA